MEQFKVEKIYYVILEDFYKENCVAIEGYEEGICDILLPSEVTYRESTYTVVVIKTGAFSGCGSLKRVQLPETLEVVQRESFKESVALEEVISPSNLTCFEKNAFIGCVRLQEEQGLLLIHDKVVDYFGDSSHVVIPNGVKKIDDYTFFENKNLDTITFPNTLEEIGDSAFGLCINLKEVVLPDSLITMRTSAFAFCDALEKVVLSDGLECLEVQVFANCRALREVVFGKGLKVIEKRVFHQCISIISLHLPPHLKIIHQEAFCDCENLEEIYVPNSVELISGYVFDWCTSLRTLAFAHNELELEKLDIYPSSFVYYETMLHISSFFVNKWEPTEQKEYYIRQLHHWEELTEKEQTFFEEAWGREQEYDFFRALVFEHGSTSNIVCYFEKGYGLSLEEIEDYLCVSIEKNNTEVTAMLLEYRRKNFTKEEMEALEHSNEMVALGLEKPTMRQLQRKWKVKDCGDVLTLVGYRGKQREEIVPEGIDTGKPIRYVPYYVFFEQVSGSIFKKMQTFPQNTSEFEPLERMLFTNGDEMRLTEGVGEWGVELFENPPEFSSIPAKICAYNKYIKKVLVSGLVEVIATSAFELCRELEEVEFSSALNRIEQAAFRGCIRLKEMAFPSTLKEIEYNAFQGCLALTELVFPASLARLNEDAFLECEGLKKVILESRNTKIHPDTFRKCDALEFLGYEDGENVLEQVRKGEVWE